MPDWKHWWWYTRLRLWGRQLRGWLSFWQVKWQVWSHCKACRLIREDILPIGVGAGVIGPWEALEEARTSEDREGRWRSWGKERTFLGASSDFPEGIYAKGGDEMACMTEDEFEHWYKNG